MTDFLPFALPDITDREKQEVLAVLDSGWLTTGPRTKQFEERFAARVGAKHAVAVNSCTAAMHLALESIGLQPDDEVIVPTLTFAATAEVVRYFGARPVLVDVLPTTHCLDPDAFAAALTPRTKAVMPVHFAGQACDMDRVLEIAQAHGVRVVEDAAHAFPASYRGRSIGSIGDVTCFSFYATKTLSTGEGGMATTNDDALAERMRIMSLHGISRDAWKRYSASGSWYYEIVAPGYKYNLTDLAAAIGLVQLDRANEMLERRRTIARTYIEAFGGVGELELLEGGDFDAHAWHLFVVKLRQDRLTIDRARFVEELRSRGIGSSVHFIPLHLHPYYQQTYGYSARSLPVAGDVYERCLSLPFYSRLSDADVERVVATALDVVRRFTT